MPASSWIRFVGLRLPSDFEYGTSPLLDKFELKDESFDDTYLIGGIKCALVGITKNDGPFWLVPVDGSAVTFFAYRRWDERGNGGHTFIVYGDDLDTKQQMQFNVIDAMKLLDVETALGLTGLQIQVVEGWVDPITCGPNFDRSHVKYTYGSIELNQDAVHESWLENELVWSDLVTTIKHRDLNIYNIDGFWLERRSLP